MTRLRRRVRCFSFGCNLIILACALVAVATIGIGLQCQTARAQAATSLPNLPPMNLTIIGLNGTVVLNSTDIASLPSASGLGGVSPNATDNYTGVPLTKLCDLVGGISNESVVRITGSDNYSQTFSYDQIVNGNFTTYDPNTGNIVPHREPLTLIIAYYKDDMNLTSQGPLMVAIIGPEGLGTSPHLWVWYAAEIQILNATAVPEFQPLSFALPLLMYAFMAVVLFKKRRTSQTRK